MIPLLALLLACSTPDAGAAPPRADDTDYRGLLDQARFQIRKEFWDQAELDLVRATDHPDGAADPEAWFLLAQVRHQRADLPGALAAAERALTNARTPDQAAMSGALIDFLRTDFALLTVRGAQPGLRWMPRLTLDGMIVDPEQQAWVARLEKRLQKERPTLPITIGLPASTWTVNGEALDLAPGARAAIELSPSAAAGGLALARLAWLEVGTGITFWARSSGGLLPSPTGSLGVTVPVGGPLVVGLFGTVTPTAILAEDGVYRFDAGAATAGFRVGPLLDDGQRFLFRPAIGYRVGTVAGERLGCERAESGFVCGDSATDRVVYARGPAHHLHAEVALDYLDRRRTSALGGGLKLIGEHALVRLPEALTLRDDGSSVTLLPSARRRSRTGVTLLANLQLAF